ncbi:hypothetical protein HID58_025283 [Brassica napus]|uniref:F-box domain-containing protein n=1 Tax=Brassica napus TaxID=3708 RepID=A0ABQ8CKN6_BRANA|nr:hypothetical protein HID58_025283 [Brassica napus]
MSKGENSVSIPMDLINEIFSRLSAKSIARFSCLSKQWRDMLDRSYFKELFFTRSSARPRLLFSVKQNGYDDLCLFSSPQPRDLYDKSRMGMVICPSMGQSTLLPEDNRSSSINYLVFDPIDKQFKVLNMSDLILTLGTREDSWRQIYCPLINLSTSKEFKFIYIDFIRGQDRMINYKGMLRTQTRNGQNMSTHFGRRINALAAVTFPLYGRIKLLLGTATCDIVLCMEDVSKQLYVFYLNIERKTLQRVEFRTANNEAFEKCSSKVILSVDHVEDPNFINMET